MVYLDLLSVWLGRKSNINTVLAEYDIKNDVHEIIIENKHEHINDKVNVLDDLIKHGKFNAELVDHHFLRRRCH